MQDCSVSSTGNQNCVPNIEKGYIERVVADFFEFYGKTYDYNKHLINVKMGQLQKRKVSKQTKLSNAFSRLFSKQPKSTSKHDIESSHEKWKNSTMHALDFKSTGINVTAEVSEQEAINFQNMCRQFQSDSSHIQIFDELALKQSEMKPSDENKPTQSVDVSTPKSSKNSSTHNSALVKVPNVSIIPDIGSVQSTSSTISTAQSSEITKKETPKLNGEGNVNHKCTEQSDVALMPCNTDKLKSLIQKDSVSKSVLTKMANLLSRSTERELAENQIISILSSFLKVSDKNVCIVPFGSTTYGLAGTQNNFNILIRSGKGSRFRKKILQ